MLTFFRRHQRIFFIVLTGVIVVSFSAFGTYNSFGGAKREDKEAFRSVDGRVVKQSELYQMQLFLSSDATDALLAGGMAGPNFLNDGVVRRDILASGMGEHFIAHYRDQLAEELQARADRERRFTGYQHPYAAFLSAENIWGTFAPNIQSQMALLRGCEVGSSEKAVKARVQLYLAESAFPQTALKDVVRFQEKQYEWLQADAMLPRRDLALFGYHSLEEWFGPRFLSLVSEFVINSSIMAEERGYRVTKAEAWGDLQRNAEVTYRQVHSSPYVTASSGAEYLADQLQRMGLDRASATALWQRVMLFRRYFEDVGNVALLDPFAFAKFQSFAHEGVDVDLYTLDKGVRLKDGADLAAFESYIEAVSTAKSPALPTEFRTAAEVREKNPELVQKSYLLEVASVDKDTLRRRFALRELWDWQLEEANWEPLSQEVPILSASSPQTREERFEILQQLDRTSRAKLDRHAQDALLVDYPHWIDEAFDDAVAQEKQINIVFAASEPLPGLRDASAFAEALDAEDELTHYTQDGEILYSIRVLERPESQEIMTFAQAKRCGAIQETVRKSYLSYYHSVRSADSATYQREDGTYKRLAEVQELLIEKRLAPLVKTLGAENTTEAAQARFTPYLEGVQSQVQSGKLPTLTGLAAQWQVTKSEETLQRHLEGGEACSYTVGTWSPVEEGGRFLYVRARHPGEENLGHGHGNRVDFARQALAAEAQCQLVTTLLTEINARS